MQIADALPILSRANIGISEANVLFQVEGNKLVEIARKAKQDKNNVRMRLATLKKKELVRIERHKTFAIYHLTKEGERIKNLTT